MKPSKIKVIWNGKKLRDIYVGASKWQVLKYKVRRFFFVIIRAAIVGIAAAIVIGSLVGMGSYLFPRTIHAIEEKEVLGVTPVLERIAQCESKSSHYCTDDLVKAGMCARSEKGQVLVKANNNKTIDVGKYQVNVYYWGAEAAKQRLNIFDEKDNEIMAKYIYGNYGTGEWSASQKCWKK